MKKYTIDVDALVTIHPAKTFTLTAENELEAKQLAENLFHEWLEENFGWVDYDEAFSEVITEN